LPKQQIELHESLVLKENESVIVDEAPSSFDNDLIGMMISISFKQNNNAIFTKKEFPGGLFCLILAGLHPFNQILTTVPQLKLITGKILEFAR
jgi:hypothetical protein